MSCPSKTLHDLHLCNCWFTPEDFLLMLDKEQRWFEILMRLTRRRAFGPEGVEDQVITVMMNDRARWLRN